MHWFDVDDRRAVDGFDGADPQSVLADLTHSNWMEAQRIWPVRRSRRKDARRPTARVRARMNLQHIALGLVQPSHNDNVIACREAVDGL